MRVYVAAPEPVLLRDFLAAVTGAAGVATAGGFRLACGAHEILVLEPAALSRRVSGFIAAHPEPHLAGMTVAARHVAAHVTAAAEACGAFIEWQPTAD